MPGLLRFAWSRGKTPLDLARKEGHKKVVRIVLNLPAWAPQRPWVFHGFSEVVVETRRQLANWKIWAMKLRFFENIQYHLES